MCGCGCGCIICLIIIISLIIFPSSMILFTYITGIMDFPAFVYIWNSVYFYGILCTKLFLVTFGALTILGFQLKAAKSILQARHNSKMAQDINLIKENLKEISIVICINLFTLFVMYKLYIYFDSEVFKLALSLYICIILGFAASFPLERKNDLMTGSDENLIVLRNMGNSTLLYSSFLLYHYDMKGIIFNYFGK
jgi:hypothetical protein